MGNYIIIDEFNINHDKLNAMCKRNDWCYKVLECGEVSFFNKKGTRYKTVKMDELANVRMEILEKYLRYWLELL